ncbi:Ankyrin repeat protein 2 [Giardia muris]|uniref:Ankyrin repeat protein 2 n=1 Tax=Giardia muris TaxID=5742 RepID=A0A4Z1SPF8_GIAMU|nr:Ankyrin repeat protein 2 [Giardia muris]|eukprot:TNJ26755.1 Ankyrin repeat protein 2 [Giardia muris]
MGLTRLMRAARANDLSAIMRSIDQVGSQDLDGWTALMHAAKNGSLDAVKFLSEHESGRRTRKGETALMLAAKSGSYDCVKALLIEASIPVGIHSVPLLKHLPRYYGNVGGDLGDRRRACFTLLEAYERQYRSMLQFLCIGEHDYAMKIFAELREIDGSDKSLLFYAVCADDVPCIERYLAQSTSLEICEDIRKNCSYAAKLGHLKVMKTLIDALATLENRTPIEVAKSFDDPFCLKALLTIEANLPLTSLDIESHTILMLAAAAGHVDLVEQYLPELGKKSNAYLTALMYAVKKHHLDCAQRLLDEAGAKSNRGKTALMLAAREGLVEFVRILAPLECKLQDQQGYTALMHAIRNDKPECAMLLLADKGFQSNSNETALILAAARGYADIVRELVETEHGTQDNRGHTALMHASINDHQDCVALLRTEIGLRTQVEYNLGWTALMYAASRGNANVIKHLMEEIRLQDNEGRTALMIAVERNNPDIIPLLFEEVDVRDNEGRTCYDYLGHNENELLKIALMACDGIKSFSKNDILDQFLIILDIKARLLHEVPESYLATSIETFDIVMDALLGFIDKPDGEEVSTMVEVMDERFYQIEEELALDTPAEVLCTICICSEPNVLFLPCRHIVTCDVCADYLDLKCPYCRQAITDGILLLPYLPPP